MRVLVVEDDPSEFEIVARLLGKIGIETKLVSTLEEAARVDDQFDVILLDLSLTDACSNQVVQYFAETARAPVILLSANEHNFSPNLNLDDDEGDDVAVYSKREIGPQFCTTLHELAANSHRRKRLVANERHSCS